MTLSSLCKLASSAAGRFSHSHLSKDLRRHLERASQWDLARNGYHSMQKSPPLTQFYPSRAEGTFLSRSQMKESLQNGNTEFRDPSGRSQ